MEAVEIGVVENPRGADRSRFDHFFQVVEGFVSFVDLAPTILHLAGAKVPSGMDGRAFMGPGLTLADLNARDETLGIADPILRKTRAAA